MTDDKPTNPVAAVMADIEKAMPKTEKNSFFKYKYVSADAMYGILRPILAKHGVAIFQNEVSWQIEANHELTERWDGTGKRPSPWMIATYDFGFMVNMESPETTERLTMTWLRENGQSSAGIRTLAQKYWLRNKLLIETGDDDDEGKTGDNAKPPARSRSTARTKPPSKPQPTKPKVSESKPKENPPAEESKEVNSAAWEATLQWLKEESRPVADLDSIVGEPATPKTVGEYARKNSLKTFDEFIAHCRAAWGSMGQHGAAWGSNVDPETGEVKE